MYWITFLIGGFIVASIPWVASHFNNYLAGYMVIVPVVFVLSISVQYLAGGPKTAIETAQGTLLGLPSFIIFGLVAIIALKNGANLPVTIALSLLAWLISLVAINSLIGN